VAILLLSSIIRQLPIISYVGRYSIIMLCTHQVIITLLVAARHFLPEMYRQTGLAESLIFFAITVGISILCCWPLKKYLPWFTAQKDLIKIPCSDVDEFLQ
jgi:fucose 4-O-acetylase-like acetyltransferase